MENPFRKRPSEQEAKSATFNIINTWNERDSGTPVFISPTKLTELAVRDLGYDKKLISNLDIELGSGVANPDKEHLRVDNSGKAHIFIPVEESLFSALDLHVNPDKAELSPEPTQSAVLIGHLFRHMEEYQIISIKGEVDRSFTNLKRKRNAINAMAISHSGVAAVLYPVGLRVPTVVAMTAAASYVSWKSGQVDSMVKSGSVYAGELAAVTLRKRALQASPEKLEEWSSLFTIGDPPMSW